MRRITICTRIGLLCAVLLGMVSTNLATADNINDTQLDTYQFHRKLSFHLRMKPLSRNEVIRLENNSQLNLTDEFLNSPEFSDRIVHNYLEDWRFQTLLNNNDFRGARDLNNRRVGEYTSNYDYGHPLVAAYYYLAPIAFSETGTLRQIINQPDASWDQVMGTQNYSINQKLYMTLDTISTFASEMPQFGQSGSYGFISRPIKTRRTGMSGNTSEISEQLIQAGNNLNSFVNEVAKKYNVDQASAVRHLMGHKRLPLLPTLKRDIDFLLLKIKPLISQNSYNDFLHVFDTEPMAAIMLVQDYVLPKAPDDIQISLLSMLLADKIRATANERWPLNDPLITSSPEFALKIIKLMTNEEDINWRNERVLNELTQDLIQSVQHVNIGIDELPGPLGTKAAVSRFDQTAYSMSAAFFRAYLCDEMKLSSTGRDDTTAAAIQRLRLTLPGESTSLSAAQSSPMNQDGHGKEDCQACHRKLDPMRSAIETPGMAINIVYDDHKGVERKIELKSGENPIAAIQKTEAYKVCQTRKFWKWFIGSDVPLVGEKAESLVKEYEELGGKIRPFILKLVNRSEFKRSRYTSEPITFSSVQPLLGKCNSCHNLKQAIVPRVDSLPIGWSGTNEYSAEHSAWIKAIMLKTNAHNYGTGATMPPASSGWKLEREDLELLTRWVNEGARDNTGKTTITKDDIAEIMDSAGLEMKESISNAGAKATMYSTWKRYIRGNELLSNTQALGEFLRNCVRRGRVLGMHDPMKGKPDSKYASNSYLNKIAECALREENTEGEDFSDSFITEIQDADIARRSGKYSSITNFFLDDEVQFNEIPDEAWARVKIRIISRFLNLPTKHSKIAEYSQLIDATLAGKKAELTAKEAIRQAAIVVLISDDFLTF